MLLPVIELAVLGPRGTVTQLALVDSGADYPVFPKKTGEDIGLNLLAGRLATVKYGGSDVVARVMRTHVRIGDEVCQPDIYFVEKLNFPYALLGRRGIFSKFNEVTFVERAKNPKIEFRY